MRSRRSGAGVAPAVPPVWRTACAGWEPARSRPSGSASATSGRRSLLIAGAEDEKFRAVAAAMAQRMRGSETAIIPAAGHNTHLENPIEFARAANDFLRRVCAVPGREEHRDAIRG